MPTGDVYDGEEEVRRYFAETRAAFPDQRNENVVLHHAEDCVVAEFDLVGTHEGELRGMPPTGKQFRTRMVALFMFEGDRIVCERVYFDQLSILCQITGGWADVHGRRDHAHRAGRQLGSWTRCLPSSR